MSSLFDYSKVRAQNASTKTIREAIDEVLKAKDPDVPNSPANACYSEMEPRLLPPGIAGSRFYDQHAAISILLDHDKKHNGEIHIMMVEKGLTERMLWDFLYKVLKTAGFRMKAGRLIGLIKDQSDKPNDDSQAEPDIE